MRITRIGSEVMLHLPDQQIRFVPGSSADLPEKVAEELLKREPHAWQKKEEKR